MPESPESADVGLNTAVAGVIGISGVTAAGNSDSASSTGGGGGFRDGGGSRSLSIFGISIGSLVSSGETERPILASIPCASPSSTRAGFFSSLLIDNPGLPGPTGTGLKLRLGSCDPLLG